LKVGLALPHYDFSSPDGAPVTSDALAEWARRAEGLGFDSVWVSDHFFLSLARYGGPEAPAGSPEALTALAALAQATERVRLGSLVLCAGFRHPALVAKSATVIDLLSGGRLDLGIGAGWYEDEYRALGYPFPSLGERFEVLEESVRVLRLLWDEGPATWEGRHFSLHGAFNHPRPAQAPGPPIWIGGKGGPRLLRLVAREADGWNTVWAWSPEDYAGRAAALDAACAEAGRDPGTVRRSVGLYTLVGDDEADLAERFRALQAWAPGGALDGASVRDWGRDKLVGTAEQVLERLETFAALGVEEVIASFASLPFAVHDASAVEAFARSVLPAAGALDGPAA